MLLLRGIRTLPPVPAQGRAADGCAEIYAYDVDPPAPPAGLSFVRSADTPLMRRFFDQA